MGNEFSAGPSQAESERNFIAAEAVVAVAVAVDVVEIMLSVGQHMFVDPSKWRCVIRLSQSRSELS